MERRYRLRAKEGFEKVKEEGHSWSHPLLILCALPNHLPYSRFGFSVSRRIGKAVARNRVRRWMREATRHRIDRILPGYDLVFIARSPVQRSSFEGVDSAMSDLLEESGLLGVEGG